MSIKRRVTAILLAMVVSLTGGMSALADDGETAYGTEDNAVAEEITKAEDETATEDDGEATGDPATDVADNQDADQTTDAGQENTANQSGGNGATIQQTAVTSETEKTVASDEKKSNKTDKKGKKTKKTKKKATVKAPKFRVKKTDFDALKVTAQKGYLKYQIQYSTKKNSGYKNFYTGTKRMKSKSLIEPGKTYYFRVRGMKKVNGKKVWSDYSKIQKKKLKRSTNSVMRWRYEVKKSLKKNHAYTKWRERAILRVIYGESKGHPGARNGQYVGLVQFGNHWKHNYSRAYFKKHNLGKYYSDNRRSAKWSIYTMAKVAKQGGNRALRQHWAATIY